MVEYDKMMSDSQQVSRPASRRHYTLLVWFTQSRASVDLSKIPVLDVAIPMQLKGSTQKGNGKCSCDVMQCNMTSHTTVGSDNSGGGMDFKLLVKKGHKQMVRDLKVPVNSELAIGLKDTQMVRTAGDQLVIMFILQAMKHEQKEMKRLVLNYEQMQVEEEIQEQHEGVCACMYVCARP